jgi:Nuclease-related domain
MEILIGAPLSGDEAYVLRRMASDLAGIPSLLILANFEIPRPKNSCQIDFVVATPARTELIELKNFDGPIFGGENGHWTLHDRSGKPFTHAGENPWQQAKNAKLFLNDTMWKYLKNTPGVPSPHTGRFFEFDASVCIYPKIDPQSRLTRGNQKAWVRSYDELIAALKTQPISSTWNLNNWRTFAVDWLHLTPVSLAGATDLTVLQAEAALASYLSRSLAIVGENLQPLLVSSDDQICGDALISKLLEPHNHLLIGKSGLGKSFHLSHLILHLSHSAEIPIDFKARHYTGQLASAIDRSLGTRTTMTFPVLLDTIRSAGLTPVLIVDNLHECNAGLVQDLLKDLYAVQLKHNARVVISSQSVVDSAGGLSFNVLELAALSSDHKRKIYCAHAGLPESESTHVDYLCGRFSNAYDLAIAGRCHKASAKSMTRFSLYKEYAATVLSKDSYSALTALLRRCAMVMDADLRYWLPRDRFDTIVEEFVKQSHPSFDVYGRLSQCRIVRMDEDSFEFEHDLLRDYFLAEHFRRAFDDVNALAAELMRPRYQHLISLIVASKPQKPDIEILLQSATSVEVLADALRGYLCPTVQQVLTDQCERVLADAVDDLPNLRLHLNDGGEGNTPSVIWPTISGNRPWSRYQSLLVELIGQNLHIPSFRNKVLQLLDMTEGILHSRIEEDARSLGLNPRGIWSEIVRVYGLLLHPSMTIPISTILVSLRASLMFPERRQLDPELRLALLERVERGTPSDFAIFLLLQTGAYGHNDVDFLIKMLLLGWNSRLPILRIEAMHMIHSQAHFVRSKHPDRVDEIADYLERMQSKDLFLGSAITEALAAFERLQLSLTSDDALNEMKELLSASSGATEPADTKGHSDAANSLIDRIFEDVFQGIYYDAYRELSTAEKIQLLKLAAHSNSVGFYTCWILQELLHLNPDHATAIFSHFASNVDATAFSPSDAAGAFTLGIIGCAKFGHAPERPARSMSQDEMAWHLLGRLLYELRSKGSIPDVQANSLWNLLLTETPFAAADALRHIETPHIMLSDGLGHVSLVTRYPAQACRLLEFSLSHRGALTTLFQWGGSKDRDLTRFIIGALGRHGSQLDLPALTSISDDPEFGTDAISAVAQIYARIRDTQK